MKEKEIVFNFSDCFIGYDVSYDKSHTCLTIMIKGKNNKKECYCFHDNEAKAILYSLTELTKMNRMLEKRLKHLFNSKLVQLLDEIDPRTHTYKYDISKFDNAYPVIISLGRSGKNIPLSIKKFYNQEFELLKLKNKVKTINKKRFKLKRERDNWKSKYDEEHFILSNLQEWLDSKEEKNICNYFICIRLMDIKNKISKLREDFEKGRAYNEN